MLKRKGEDESKDSWKFQTLNSLTPFLEVVAPNRVVGVFFGLSGLSFSRTISNFESWFFFPRTWHYGHKSWNCIKYLMSSVS